MIFIIRRAQLLQLFPGAFIGTTGVLFLTVTKCYNSKNTAIRSLHAERRAEANWLHVL